jgi:Mn-dependent DtxR family transcriptional regulator
MFPPTAKQRKLEHIIERLTVDGVPPSLTEIAAELGVTYAAARELSNRLCARGRARKQFRMPRTLELIREGKSA